MASTFFARAAQLAERVSGVYTGSVAVDQVYAAPIERGFWVTGPLAGHTNHPRHGGQTHYLRDGLHENADAYIANWADHALDPDGLYAASVENVEVLSAQVESRAPVEFGNLRASAHPVVERDGAVVYDRPAAVPRLSRDELRELRRGQRGD